MWFVSLAAIEQTEHIAGAILNSLGLGVKGGESARSTGSGLAENRLHRHLRKQNSLLILDNFEQLAEQSGQFLLDLLAAAPNTTLLITSRHILNLQAEWLYALDGLPMPTDDNTPLDRNAAAQLFIFHAGRRVPDFDPTAHDADIRTLCRLVNGWPLALELAGASLRQQSLAKLLTRMLADMQALKTRQRDIPARHRSMEAMFDTSWRLLSDEERRVLSGAAHFRGGFDDTAAAGILGASLDTLDDLTDKSLLILRDDRRQMHEQIRQFAMARSSVEEVADHHAAWYLDLVKQHKAALVGAAPQHATATLNSDPRQYSACMELRQWQTRR